MIVPPEDNTPQDNSRTEDLPTDVSNSSLEATVVKVDSTESAELKPSLVTRQSGDKTSRIWLNGEFRTKPWFPLAKASQGPTDSIDGEDSDLVPDPSGSEDEGT